MAKAKSYLVIYRDDDLLPDGFVVEHEDTDDAETLARLQLADAAMSGMGYRMEFSSEEPEITADDDFDGFESIDFQGRD